MKPNETWLDGISVTLIGFFLCLALRRTGHLGFAIGFHAMFDFAALFLLFDRLYRGARFPLPVTSSPTVNTGES